MTQPRHMLLLLLLNGVPTTIAAATDNNNHHHHNINNNNTTIAADDYEPSSSSVTLECGLWYGPSTIPGAGYGLFAGRDFAVDDLVIPGDLVVPLVEVAWHSKFSDMPNLWENYQWAASVFPGMEEEGHSASGASFGVGSLPNCWFPLVNIEDETTRLDNAGLHRSRDPGVGAFTPYHHRTTKAYQPIPNGMEIFLHYGNKYFASRESEYGVVPLPSDYERGNKLLKKLVLLVPDLLSNNKNNTVDTTTLEDVSPLQQEEQESSASSLSVSLPSHDHCAMTTTTMPSVTTSCKNTNSNNTTTRIDGSPALSSLSSDVSTTISSWSTDLLDLLQSLGTLWKAKPLLVLPDEPRWVAYLHHHGTEYRHYHRSRRSATWLAEHALCMDHLRPSEQSRTAPQAGRAAVAARDLPQHSIVAPVPLVHIPNRSLYDMYDWEHVVTEQGKSEFRRKGEQPAHQQLMVNYCWGHEETTVLLCPYGIGVPLINHSSNHSNVRLQWSTKGTRHPEWFNQSPDEWGSIEHAGLALELVATRAIAEGEEILLNYGDAWQAAWERHVAQWQPPPGADHYVPAYELNDRVDVVVRTLAEGSYNTETDKILFCRDYYLREQGFVYWDDDDEEIELHRCHALFRYPTSVQSSNTSSTSVSSDSLYRYVAVVYEDDVDDLKNPAGMCERVIVAVLFDLPRDAFTWEDAYYARDHAQFWSFRHSMGLPDELLPLAWRNIPPKEEALPPREEEQQLESDL